MIKIVNNTVPSALFKLGYTHEQADAIVSYVDATGTIEGAPHIKDEHLAVFDCSFKPAKGTRSIAIVNQDNIELAFHLDIPYLPLDEKISLVWMTSNRSLSGYSR